MIETGCRAQLRRIAVPYTRMNKQICTVLYEEGLITALQTGDTQGPFHRGFPVPITPDNVSSRKIWLDLKYRLGESVLKRMRCVSKPSRKVIASVDELKVVCGASQSGLLKPVVAGQVMLINTKELGVVEIKDAIRHECGGEVLCYAQ